MWAIPFHNIDPIIFRITPSISLNWYGLSYLAGVIFVMWKSEKMARKYQPEFPTDIFKNFMFWTMMAIVIGARLGDVLFYNLHYYWHHPLEILATWKGGMSFHGGLIGSLFVTIFYTRHHKVKLTKFGDILGVNAPVALMFGRLANFINGELYGHISDVPWAIPFPKGGYTPRHPSQLYEALLEGLFLHLILRAVYKRYNKRPGIVSASFLIGYGLARFSVEYLREGEALSWFPSSPITGGQLLSLPMIASGLIWLVFVLFCKKPKL